MTSAGPPERDRGLRTQWPKPMMNYLKVIGFVIVFLLILTGLFYVIGIYNM